MMARTIMVVSSTVNRERMTFVISPSTLIDGGKPAVTKRSDPFLDMSAPMRSRMSLAALSRSIDQYPILTERTLVDGDTPGMVLHDQLLPQHVLQALVQRLHLMLAAGLNGRIHLRHLVFA